MALTFRNIPPAPKPGDVLVRTLHGDTPFPPGWTHVPQADGSRWCFTRYTGIETTMAGDVCVTPSEWTREGTGVEWDGSTSDLISTARAWLR